MFLQLQHAGVLGRQRAVLFGDFTDCTPEKTKRYPYSLDEVLESVRGWLSCPVLTGLPFGHVARKMTLPFGPLSLGRGVGGEGQAAASRYASGSDSVARVALS
jgi:muramoyltetrapeptide carboxypeptidase